ncbi:MAG: multiheme c-type cytochrome [Pirellulales bacterium]
MPARRTQLHWMKVASFVMLGAGLTAGVIFAATSAAPEGAAPAPRQKVDPIKANGAIFEGWPKPDLAIVFTGELDGYLEPCGCAGLENQKGGLKRRATFIKQLRDQGWPVIAVDAGGQEKRTGEQATLKTEFAYQALMKMGYDVVGFGENDLKLDLLQMVLNFEDEKKNPLVSANVGIVDFDSGYTKPYKIIERGGMKIGITTVLGKKQLAQFKNSPDYKVLDPELAIPRFAADLLNAKCDHLILLVNADPDEAKALAAKYRSLNFDWVMITHGAEEPPNVLATVTYPQNKLTTNLVEVGHKGMYAVVIGFYKNGSPAVRYQRVPLDHRFADSQEIYNMQVEYQRKLQQLGWSGLNLKTLPHPNGGKFAGSKVCADCHTNAAEVYEHTPHSHAMETLQKRTNPPREFDPECVSCHVVGWESQKHFPFESGFVSMQKTPQLADVGCENCHGPAAGHVAAEQGETQVSDAEKEKLREQLRMKIVPNEGNQPGQVFDKGKVVQTCVQCHDTDNSPSFDFQKYWPKVKHEGKD